MSTFLAGLAAAAVLTALTVIAYDFAEVTTLESLSLPGVHAETSVDQPGPTPVQARKED